MATSSTSPKRSGRRSSSGSRTASSTSTSRATCLDFLPALKDGDSFPHGSGFLVHRRLRRGYSRASYVASAGSHRQPGGQDVLGGVDVPVVPGAAGGARPAACPEAEGGEQVPAR